VRPGSPLAILVGALLATGAATLVVGLLLALEGRSPLGAVRCFFRGRHEARRHPLGGFRCEDCRAVGATLDELGYEGTDYVTPPAAHEHRRQARDTEAPRPGIDVRFYRPAGRRS
jgi:hypothetical protein